MISLIHSLVSAIAFTLLFLLAPSAAASGIDAPQVAFPVSAAPTVAFTTAPAPTITGTLKVGATLTAAPGTWAPTPTTLTYQWKRGGTAITGATKKTYVPVAADAGKTITVTITATRTGYTTTNKTSTGKTIPNKLYVAGVIKADAVWPDGVTVIIRGPVSIAPGVTVTAQSGAIVKLSANATFVVEGSFVVNGSAARKVTLTSLSDDAIGGDADGGGASVGSAWPGITVGTGGSLSIVNSLLRFGSLWSDPGSGPITVSNSVLEHAGISLGRSIGSVQINNNVVRNSPSDGILLRGAEVGAILAVRDNTVTGSAGIGIDVFDGVGWSHVSAATPVVTGNKVDDSAGYAIRVSSATLDYSRLSPNSGSGNGVNALSLAGILSADATWAPPTGTQLAPILRPSAEAFPGLTVKAGATLTLKPGFILKVSNGDWCGVCADANEISFIVEGALVSAGTASKPVTITALTDDSIGGDTGGDGSSSDIWLPDLYLFADASVSMDYTTVRFASLNVWPGARSVSISNSTFDQSGIHIERAAGPVVVDNNRILHSPTEGIFVGGAPEGAALTVRGNLVKGSIGHGIDVSDGVSWQYGSGATPVVTGNTVTGARRDDHSGSEGYAIRVSSNTLDYTELSPNYGTGNAVNAMSFAGTLVSDATWSPPTGTQLTPTLGHRQQGFTRFTIASGATLTLKPGFVLKSSQDAFRIEGALVAEGSSAHPVTATSTWDDSIGVRTRPDDTSTVIPWPGFVVAETGSVEATNLTILHASTAIETSGTVTLRGATISGADSAVHQWAGASTLDMTVSDVDMMLTLATGSAEIRGRYVGQPDHAIVTACSWESEQCLVDAAHMDWSDARGPVTAGLICGAVIGNPWNGAGSSTPSIWSTPNCGGALYTPEATISSNQAQATDQVAGWQALCGVEGYEAACEVAGIYSSCLASAQQLARDNVTVSFPAVPTTGADLGSYAAEKIGDSMKASLSATPRSVGSVMSGAAKVFSMFNIFRSLAESYEACAPGAPPTQG